MVADREQELSRIVVVKKGAVANLLTPQERQTVAGRGSEYPQTFEDTARELVKESDPRAAFLKKALEEYVAAVNALWEYTIQQGYPERLVSMWRRRNKRYDYIPREDLEAEAIFKLRHVIATRDAEEALAPLFNYAVTSVHHALTEFVGQSGPVNLPRDQARLGPAPRVDLKHADDE